MKLISDIVIRLLPVLAIILSSSALCCADNNVVRKAYRMNLPWLGIGMFCSGCPARSCEDDPAVVTGYCCGCSRLFDQLPVQCSSAVLRTCPLNLHGLCHDYEYMLRCCC